MKGLVEVFMLNWLWVLMAADSPVSDELITQYETILTGGQSRTWAVEGKPWRPRLGNGCESGELWVFSTGNVWERTTCIGGVSVKRSGQWDWDRSEEQLKIRLDDQSYRIDIRRRAADVPGDPVVTVVNIRTQKATSSDATLETKLLWQDF